MADMKTYVEELNIENERLWRNIDYLLHILEEKIILDKEGYLGVIGKLNSGQEIKKLF